MIYKDNSIWIWRIVFTYLIMIFHFFNSYGIPSKLYLATDFFFLVSGFFLAKEASEYKYTNALHMIAYKVRKYYPHYIFSLIVSLLVFSILGQGPQVNGFELFLESTFLSMIGVNIKHMVNVPTWYISVMLLAGYIIYFLLINHRKLFVHFVVPISIIMIISWFYRNIGFLSHSTLGENITTDLYMNRPLILGYMIMSIGVILYEYTSRTNILGGRKVEIAIFLLAIVLSCIKRIVWIDCVVIILLAYGIAIGVSGKECSLAKYKMSKYLGKIAFPMYLNHNLFRELMPYYFMEFHVYLLILYLMVVTIYSVVTLEIVNCLKKYIERRFFYGKNNYCDSSCKGK